MAVLGLHFCARASLVVASGGPSSLRCAGLSLSRPLLLRSTGSRCAGSVIVAHGPSCSAACGILPDQGSNPCPLHQQADSQPLRHQGSPNCKLLKEDNQRQYFLAFWVRMDLLQTEVQNTKKKIDKFSTIKMKNFWSLGYTVMAVK